MKNSVKLSAKRLKIHNHASSVFDRILSHTQKKDRRNTRCPTVSNYDTVSELAPQVGIVILYYIVGICIVECGWSSIYLYRTHTISINLSLLMILFKQRRNLRQVSRDSEMPVNSIETSRDNQSAMSSKAWKVCPKEEDQSMNKFSHLRDGSSGGGVGMAAKAEEDNNNVGSPDDNNIPIVPIPNSKPREPDPDEDTYSYRDFATIPSPSLGGAQLHPQSLQAQKLPAKLASMLSDQSK